MTTLCSSVPGGCRNAKRDHRAVPGVDRDRRHSRSWREDDYKPLFTSIVAQVMNDAASLTRKSTTEANLPFFRHTRTHRRVDRGPWAMAKLCIGLLLSDGPGDATRPRAYDRPHDHCLIRTKSYGTGTSTRRAALHVRVSTSEDEGIRGARGRDKRPGLDALLEGRCTARREFGIVAQCAQARCGEAENQSCFGSIRSGRRCSLPSRRSLVREQPRLNQMTIGTGHQGGSPETVGGEESLQWFSHRVVATKQKRRQGTPTSPSSSRAKRSLI